MLENDDKIFIYLYAGAENEGGGISDDDEFMIAIGGLRQKLAQRTAGVSYGKACVL